MNGPENIPLPPTQNKKPKRQGYGKIVILCVCFALIGVLLSGAAAYLGYNVASRNNASSQSSITTTVDNNTSSSSLGPTAEIVDVSGIIPSIRPSVVEITTEVVSSGNSIFGQYISQGAGSGVIISEDGYIVTNNHVIEDANSIQVTTADGTEYPAELIGTDPQTDIAIIKIEANDLDAAVFGNSDTLQVGEPVIAIGNPLGSLGGTVTTGIISATGREILVENETRTLLQIDAAINPGNSGGGLFNTAGQLVGIVNAKKYASGIEGLGFAIPISDVDTIITDLKEHGTVISRAYLNVTLSNVTNNSIFASSDLEPGVYIAQIVEGGAADKAGLQVGDRLITVNGETVTDVAQVKKIVQSMAVGDTIPITYSRDGVENTVNVVLGSSIIE